MTAAELITALQAVPPETPVYIQAQVGFFITDDVVPQYTTDLRGIIPFYDADDYMYELGSDKFFVYISSPY